MLKKLLVVISVFGIAFLQLPEANADQSHGSARIVNSSGNTQLQFGITLPADLIPDTDRMFSLSSPNCGGNTGSGIPTINCGSYAPFFRFCSQKDGYLNSTPGTINASYRCFYSLVKRQYSGGSNITEFYASQVSTSSGSGWFDDSFTLHGDNYYTVDYSVDPLTHSDCMTFSTSNNCTYVVEYYNGSQYIPYIGVGIDVPVLSSAYWTPARANQNNNNNNNGSINANCASLEGCAGQFVGRFINGSSIFGQAIQVYQDFFKFESSSGTAWKDINPLTTNCDYPAVNFNATNQQLPPLMNPPYYTGSGQHPATAVCCVGPVFEIQALKVIDSQMHPGLNNNIHNLLGNFRQEKYFTPFKACSGQIRDISQGYILPITSALIYISFAFFLSKFFLALFGLNNNNGSTGATAAGFVRRRKKGE